MKNSDVPVGISFLRGFPHNDIFSCIPALSIAKAVRGRFVRVPSNAGKFEDDRLPMYIQENGMDDISILADVEQGTYSAGEPPPYAEIKPDILGIADELVVVGSSIYNLPAPDCVKAFKEALPKIRISAGVVLSDSVPEGDPRFNANPEYGKLSIADAIFLDDHIDKAGRKDAFLVKQFREILG